MDFYKMFTAMFFVLVIAIARNILSSKASNHIAEKQRDSYLISASGCIAIVIYHFLLVMTSGAENTLNH